MSAKWYAHKSKDSTGYTEIYVGIAAEHDEDFPGTGLATCYCGIDGETAEARANRIANAVNSHAALVEACEAALAYCEFQANHSTDLGVDSLPPIKTLRAALALAKEEK